MTSNRRQGERGAAFLIALGGLAMIGALSAAALTLTTGPATRASAAIERAKAERAAESAIHRLAVAFVRPEERQRAPRDGTVISTSFQNAELTISAQDALGLIDINLAEADVLERLLIATGAPAEDAEIIAADWVEARRNLGREGYPSLDAVRQATPQGLRAEVASALTHATVWSGEPGVDPSIATAPALAAAANLELSDAQAFVARRTLDGPRAALPEGADTSLLRRSEGRVARISVRVETPGGGRAAMTAVIERTGSPRRPVIFRSWR